MEEEMFEQMVVEWEEREFARLELGIPQHVYGI